MPPFGGIIKTSDDLWRIIAFIRSVNPGSLTGCMLGAFLVYFLKSFLAWLSSGPLPGLQTCRHYGALEDVCHGTAFQTSPCAIT